MNKYVDRKNSHNPYFSRWFSAIEWKKGKNTDNLVTILILVDGFLQYSTTSLHSSVFTVTILILVDGFLQFCVTFLI